MKRLSMKCSLCDREATFSYHEYGTHPSEVYEACVDHLGLLLDPRSTYIVFEAGADLPRDR